MELGVERQFCFSSFAYMLCFRFTKGGPKTDSQFYFWDNFGNSAPILIDISSSVCFARYCGQKVWWVEELHFYAP